ETFGSAGCVAEFDCSGSGPIRRIVVCAVFPHPDPLPQGEGTASIAQWKADVSGLFAEESRVHPLPKGEGRGEGKQTTATRNEHGFALACAHCPKGRVVLSRSSFQTSGIVGGC